MCLHTHTQFMDYFFVNSSCPWQNANNVQISYWVNYQINSWTAFVYIISDARNPQILSVSNSPDWPETCSNPPLSLWSARIRGTKCYMTSYNLSSVVAIAKKMIRKENSRVSICIISKFTNSLVYMASSKTAKSYIGTGLKIQKKKKKNLLMWRMHPLSKEALSCCKQNGFIFVLQSSFLLGQKSTLWEYKIVLHNFQFLCWVLACRSKDGYFSGSCGSNPCG